MQWTYKQIKRTLNSRRKRYHTYKNVLEPLQPLITGTPTHESRTGVDCAMVPTWCPKMRGEEELSNSTQETRRRSPSLPALEISIVWLPLSTQCSAQRSPSQVPSVNPPFCKVCYDTFHLTPQTLHRTLHLLVLLATVRLWNLGTSSGRQRRKGTNCLYMFRCSRFRSSGRGGSSSSNGPPRVSRLQKNFNLYQRRKTRAGGSLIEYPQYKTLSEICASDKFGYASSTNYRESPNSGTPLESAERHL